MFFILKRNISKNLDYKLILIVTSILGIFTTFPAKAELSVAEINSIARQTTVLIAPSLTEDLEDELVENRRNPLANLENSDGVWNPGSGVIIARENNKYYVLTVAHNFKQRHLDQNFAYGIRTSDGKVHVVEEINDGRGCPLNENLDQRSSLIRFGCYSFRVSGGLQGLDLAVVTFSSKSNYAIASIGNTDDLEIGDPAYLSGWPDPEKEKDPDTGKCRGKVAKRTRRLASVMITGKIDNLDETQYGFGYSLFYIDYTRPGMSGGPVFDKNGFLIGIHGRGSQQKDVIVKKYCSYTVPTINFESEDRLEVVEKAKSLENQPDKADELHTDYSSSQSLKVFLSLKNQFGLSMDLSTENYPEEIIENAIQPVLLQVTQFGVLDFYAEEDLVNSPSPQQAKIPSYDVIEDIYSSFSLSNLLRDEPSSGCGFLLIGDPCR